jgi:hypothetical protein
MDVDAALQSQIRNIEATYGKPLDYWLAVISASGLTKHNEVVAMLKGDHGLAHGAAHRLSLVARQRHDAGAAPAPDPAGALYAGAKAALRPLHDALLGEVGALGAYDIAPKKGYLSLRRRKQFAMVQPSTTSTTSRIDLGLILPATTPAAGRLEPAAKFNPLFTHASASPQPPTLTTSCAAGSLPRTRSPDSHPAARPPLAQVDRAIRACLSGAHSYLPRARSQKAGQHHRGSRSRGPDSGTSADDGCLQARFARFMALGSAAGRRVPPRALVPCCQVPRRG